MAGLDPRFGGKVAAIASHGRFLVLASFAIIGLAGCRDFADAVDVGFLNESNRLLFIVFRSPQGLVATAGASPGSGGLALRHPTFGDWRGGTVDILSEDCQVITSFGLDQRDVVFVVRESLAVDVVPIAQTGDRVRKTDLNSDIPCPVQPAQGQGIDVPA